MKHTYALLCLLMGLGVFEATAQEREVEEEKAATFTQEVRAQKPEGGLWEIGPEVFTPGRRTFEALSYAVPGWYASSNGGLAFGIGANSSGQLSLRGLGGRPTTQLLVLEDGVPDVMGLFGHPLADAHPAAFVAFARVLPGGDSVLYGSGAMAGTLLLETPGLKPGAARANGLESLGLEVELGGPHTAQGLLFSTGGGAAVHHYASFVRMARSEGHRPFSAAQQADALAKLEWVLAEGLLLSLKSRVDAFSGADPGPVQAPFENHHYKALRLSQSARLQGLWGRHALSATAFANFGQHRFWDSFSSRDGLFGLMAQHRYALRVVQLLWGVDARLATGYARREEGPLGQGTHREAGLGLFAQAEWLPIKTLRAVAGGRFQQVEGQGFMLGKAELHYTPLAWLNTHTRYFQNFRSPTLAERHLAMPVANPNLKVERSDTADVGLSLQSPVGQLKLAGFLTRARHLIAVTGAPPALQRENVDRLKVYGVEGQWEVQARSLRASLSLGRQWPDSRRMRVPHTQLSAQLGYHLPHWAFSLHASTWLGLLNEKFSPMPPLTTTGALVEFAPSPPVRLWLRASNLLGQKRAMNFGYPLPGFELFAGLRLEAKP